jgi:hypothetical protein
MSAPGPYDKLDKTSTETILSEVCDWMKPETGRSVFRQLKFKLFFVLNNGRLNMS